MKKLLLSLLVLGAIALVAVIHDMNTKDRGSSGVSISIRDIDTGEGINTGTLMDGTGKCLYGPMSWKSMAFPTSVDFEIKVPPANSEHPSVIVHFVVKEGRASKEFDRTLSVWPGPFAPEQMYWLSLNDHLKTVAYYGTTISM